MQTADDGHQRGHQGEQHNIHHFVAVGADDASRARILVHCPTPEYDSFNGALDVFADIDEDLRLQLNLTNFAHILKQHQSDYA